MTQNLEKIVHYIGIFSFETASVIITLQNINIKLRLDTSIQNAILYKKFKKDFHQYFHQVRDKQVNDYFRCRLTQIHVYARKCYITTL